MLHFRLARRASGGEVSGALPPRLGRAGFSVGEGEGGASEGSGPVSGPAAAMGVGDRHGGRREGAPAGAGPMIVDAGGSAQQREDLVGAGGREDEIDLDLLAAEQEAAEGRVSGPAAAMGVGGGAGGGAGEGRG